jgi:hypothetical protein
MQVPAGRYLFDLFNRKGPLTVEAAAGDEYFVRLDAGYDCGAAGGSDPTVNCVDRDPSIETSDATTARAQLANLKLIGPDQVKNRRVVTQPHVK